MTTDCCARFVDLDGTASFVIFCTRADAVPDAYMRYLVNSPRESFDLPGTPIRLTLREKKNPFRGGDGLQNSSRSFLAHSSGAASGMRAGVGKYCIDNVSTML